MSRSAQSTGHGAPSSSQPGPRRGLAARLLLPALVLSTACAGLDLDVPAGPPRHSLGKTGLRVAVVDFADARGHTDDPMSAWVLVPFVPWTQGEDARPEEPIVGPESGAHFTRQLTRVLVEHLRASRLFGQVEHVRGPVDPAAYDLVLRGELRESRARRLRTTYGLTVAGAALWVLGLPIGWNETSWEIDAHLVHAGKNEVLKSLRVQRREKRWTGLYWGASGTPDDEARVLGQVMNELLHGVDRALEEVPALAALSARPASAEVATSGAIERADMHGLIIVPEVAPSPAQRALLDVIGQALSRRVDGSVMGLADLDGLLGWERTAQLLGCAEPACWVDTSTLGRAEAVLRVRFATAGDQQAVTFTLLEPAKTRVAYQTTWRAVGADPYALAARSEAIADELVGGWNRAR